MQKHKDNHTKIIEKIYIQIRKVKHENEKMRFELKLSQVTKLEKQVA